MAYTEKSKAEYFDPGGDRRIMAMALRSRPLNSIALPINKLQLIHIVSNNSFGNDILSFQKHIPEICRGVKTLPQGLIG